MGNLLNFSLNGPLKRLWRGTMVVSTTVVVLLGCCQILVVSAEGLTADEVFMAYFRGDDSRVDELLAEMSASDRFHIGMAAYSEQELKLAEHGFRSALSANTENQRARLELGRVLFEQRQLDESERIFREVMNADVPPVVAQNVNNYLARIDEIRADENRRRLQVTGADGGVRKSRFVLRTQIAAGVTYDSNANFGPESDAIRVKSFNVAGLDLTSLEVNDASKPQSAWGAFGYARLGVTQNLRADRRLQGVYELELFQNWLDELSRLELRSLGGAVGLRVVGVRSYVDLPLKYAVIQLDGDDFLEQGIFRPSYHHFISKTLQSVTRLEVREKRFDTSEVLDGTEYDLKQLFRQKFGGIGHVVSIGLSVFYDDTESAFYRNQGWSAETSGEYVLGNDWVATGGIGVRQAFYDEPEALAPEDREDLEWIYSVGVYRSFLDGWSGSMNYQRIETDSTFGIYSYNRDLITVSTAKEF